MYICLVVAALYLKTPSDGLVKFNNVAPTDAPGVIIVAVGVVDSTYGDVGADMSTNSP